MFQIVACLSFLFNVPTYHSPITFFTKYIYPIRLLVKSKTKKEKKKKVSNAFQHPSFTRSRIRLRCRYDHRYFILRWVRARSFGYLNSPCFAHDVVGSWISFVAHIFLDDVYACPCPGGRNIYRRPPNVQRNISVSRVVPLRRSLPDV